MRIRCQLIATLIVAIAGFAEIANTETKADTLSSGEQGEDTASSLISKSNVISISDTTRSLQSPAEMQGTLLWFQVEGPDVTPSS